MLKCNSAEVSLLGPEVIQSRDVKFCRLFWMGYNIFFFVCTHFIQLSVSGSSLKWYISGTLSTLTLPASMKLALILGTIALVPWLSSLRRCLV